MSASASGRTVTVTEGSNRVAPQEAQRFVFNERARLARKIEKKEVKLISLRKRFNKIESMPLERNEILVQIPVPPQQKDA